MPPTTTLVFECFFCLQREQMGPSPSHPTNPRVKSVCCTPCAFLLALWLLTNARKHKCESLLIRLRDAIGNAQMTERDQKAMSRFTAARHLMRDMHIVLNHQLLEIPLRLQRLGGPSSCDRRVHVSLDDDKLPGYTWFLRHADVNAWTTGPLREQYPNAQIQASSV
ncbi:hypothetical protein AC578_7767 [Pseudocercospora eumusae]|uniref:Uncharacterized protein n=1 Tax=Pseudocercospora eumusae TaxID=321146 RepID=A0A139H137_9PEZI|nr:hypothetical protein AC578_7767 [Pseudocercospora eumusae]